MANDAAVTSGRRPMPGAESKTPGSGAMAERLKALAPVALAVLLALLPPPEGLQPHAWYYTAIFAGVVLALVLEPIPGALIGLIGVTVVALLSPWVLYSPEQLARPDFRPA